MQNTFFIQQANAVTQRFLEQIEEDNENVRQEIRLSEQKLFSAFEGLTAPTVEQSPPTTPPQKANSTVQDVFN